MIQTLHFLLENGILDKHAHEQLVRYYKQKPMSIFWHIRTLLYLGVSLVASGIGILIYQNIEGIGHAILIGGVGLASAGCLYVGFTKSPDFSLAKTATDNPWVDYIVLLGCLLFLAFEGYLQYQYEVFGARYGLATLLPAAALFFLAYRFDHLGILSMAITLFASWLGISLTPTSLLTNNDFSAPGLIYAGLILAAILVGVGYLSRAKGIKAHFTFTYYNFGIHLGAVAILSATFTFDYGWLWIFLLTPLIGFAYWYARREKSFYFLLVAACYGYIVTSYLIIKGMFALDSDFILWAYILLFYFIGTALYAIKFLKNAHKKMNADDRL